MDMINEIADSESNDSQKKESRVMKWAPLRQSMNIFVKNLNESVT